MQFFKRNVKRQNVGNWLSPNSHINQNVTVSKNKYMSSNIGKSCCGSHNFRGKSNWYPQNLINSRIQVTIGNQDECKNPVVLYQKTGH